MLDAFEKKNEEFAPEEKKKQKSFIDTITEKIIDNIKVTIKNIHIRLEYGLDDRSFSFGACLQSIESFTTDEN